MFVGCLQLPHANMQGLYVAWVGLVHACNYWKHCRDVLLCGRAQVNQQVFEHSVACACSQIAR